MRKGLGCGSVVVMPTGYVVRSIVSKLSRSDVVNSKWLKEATGRSYFLRELVQAQCQSVFSSCLERFHLKGVIFKIKLSWIERVIWNAEKSDPFPHIGWIVEDVAAYGAMPKKLGFRKMWSNHPLAIELVRYCISAG